MPFAPDGLAPSGRGCNHHYMSTGENEAASGESESGSGANGIGEQIKGWFAGRLPGEWFTGPAEIIADREEITIVGTLPAPESGAGGSDAERAAAAEGRIKRFREETRAKRIEIARSGAGALTGWNS